MKKLLRFVGYTSLERLDDILDKVFTYGRESLRTEELEFLDAFSSGNEENIHEKILLSEFNNIFEDDSGNFRFEYLGTEYTDDEVHHLGVLYVPDLVLSKRKTIKGRLEGKIIIYKNLLTSVVFNNDKYDVFEFCYGLEYELDAFIEQILQSLDDITNH